jgi:hypothetical protein
VALDEGEKPLCPLPFSARSQIQYGVPFVRPVTVVLVPANPVPNSVAVPELFTVFVYTRYCVAPVTAPQDTSITESPEIRPGALGTAGMVVAFEAFENGPMPPAFSALTQI